MADLTLRDKIGIAVASVLFGLLLLGGLCLVAAVVVTQRLSSNLIWVVLLIGVCALVVLLRGLNQ